MSMESLENGGSITSQAPVETGRVEPQVEAPAVEAEIESPGFEPGEVNEVSNEQLDIFVDETESNIDQEAAEVLVESEKRIESQAQDMGISPEMLETTREEERLDTQLEDIKSESDQLAEEAKSDIELVMQEPLSEPFEGTKVEEDLNDLNDNQQEKAPMAEAPTETMTTEAEAGKPGLEGDGWHEVTEPENTMADTPSPEIVTKTAEEETVSTPEEQAEQEHQRKLNSDPTSQFLHDQGFQGDPKVLYSMDIISGKNSKGEILMGNKIFDNFEDLQDFIKNNPDTLAQKQKDQMKEGIMPFGVGYDKSVYDWSGSLSPEKTQQMDGAFDSFAAQSFDTRRWESKEKTLEQVSEKMSEAEAPTETMTTEAEAGKPGLEGDGWHEIVEPENSTVERPGGITEEEIESKRKRIEELMPAEGPRKKEETAEETIERKRRLEDFVKRQQKQEATASYPEIDTKPAGEEREQNQSKVENPFQTLTDSPETYLDRLEDYEGPNTYSPKKAIGATMEALQKLYPDKKQRTDRIQEILGQYDALRDDNRKKRPDADEFSHEAFAINQTAHRLSDVERQAMEKIIKDKIDIRYSNGGSMNFTKEYVLGSFIQFLEGIKK